VEVAGDAAAKVFSLAHVDDFAFGILVEIHAGLGGNGADFLEKIHQEIFVFYSMSGCANLLQVHMRRVTGRAESSRNLVLAVCAAIGMLFTGTNSALGQATASVQTNKTEPPEQKKGDVAPAAAKSDAHHFDRVVIIVLENGDYEAAVKDKNLSDLAAHGASFSNFHALFHPSYPNYLAMVAGTDFGVHRARAISGGPAGELSQ